MQQEITREMTMEEIEAEFDGEWVLIGDPEHNQYLEVVRGQVLCHNADPDEFNLRATEIQKRSTQNTTSLYVGEVAERMKFWLSGWREIQE